MMPQSQGGIDAPATIGEGTPSFEITVQSQSTLVYITTDRPQTSTTATVGPDGKVTVTVPPGTKAGAAITITDDHNPPATAYIEIVSTAR